MGLALFELKKFAEAAEQMRQCIIKRKLPSLSPVNQDVFTAAPNHCLALCLAKTGDEAGGEKAFQAAMNEPGQGMDVRLDYAKFLAGRNQQIEALKLLHAMVSTSSGNAAVWRLGGEIALSKPEFLGFARDWTGEAIRHAGDNAIIAAQRGEALMLSGDLAGAMEFWERAWNVAPEPAWLAALILCQLAASPSTHAPRNESEEALVSREFIAWYRKLLAMRAQPVIVQLNDHTEKLARALPGAAKILEATLAEIRRCA
jgi:tetratricopeptide (TPR) repeat protein